MGGVVVRIIVIAAGREASCVGVTEGVALDCVDGGIGGVRGCVIFEGRWDTYGREGLGAIF